LNSAYTGNPVVHYSAFDSEPRLISLAVEVGATAIFTGEIGDDIFAHAPSPEVLAECYETLGPSLRFARAAADYAELMRISIWAAAAVAARYSAWQRRTPYWSLYDYKRQFFGIDSTRSLVTDEAVRAYEAALTRFIHPWFRNVHGMPLGRTMLTYALVAATSTWTHSAFAGNNAGLFRMPFANQPLVEAFCAIPSHLHFLHGENGAVARRAFRDRLSDDVLKRGTGKGSIELWLQDLIPRHRGFLKEVLLDGILVRERILDRNKVGAMLSGTVDRSRVGAEDLIAQLYTESWLRRWTSTDIRAVA
jgi:asparagine synthase (glutamine-hydrolysing)